MKPGKRELRILEAEKEKARMYEKEIKILEEKREKSKKLSRIGCLSWRRLGLKLIHLMA